MKSHVLITGAGGYIGSTLVPILLADGYRVKAIDTFWFGYHLLPDHPQLNCLTIDTRDMQADVMQDIDVVIDLAALSNDPCGEAFAAATWQINHLARVRTATLAKQAGVRQYILASSCSVYGYHDEPRSETSTSNPLTTYAKANLAAETDTLAMATENFHVTALRLSTLFGVSPRMRLDLVVNSMCYSAWRHGEITINGGGSQRRPLLHVADLADCFACLLGIPSNQLNGNIINVGASNMNVTIDDIATGIAREFLELLSRRINLRHCGPQDLRSYQVDFSKIASLTAWHPKRTWKQEILPIIRFLEKCHPEDLRKCHTLDWYRSGHLEQHINRNIVGNSDPVLTDNKFQQSR